ncbi:MAG TPA: hypothetical protein VLL48_14780, partial [Longimicrobiales bacterium]|nr:hypothetical protein [Longimicrobiales bacterium]
MRKLLTGAALAAALLALPSQARAQASLGPILSWHDDFDLGIGMIVGVPLPGLDQNVEFLGDFSIFFPEPDGMDMWQINSGVTYV